MERFLGCKLFGYLLVFSKYLPFHSSSLSSVSRITSPGVLLHTFYFSFYVWSDHLTTKTFNFKILKTKIELYFSKRWRKLNISMVNGNWRIIFLKLNWHENYLLGQGNVHILRNHDLDIGKFVPPPGYPRYSVTVKLKSNSFTHS